MNPITVASTETGKRIEEQSFAIIDQEVGAHAYRADEWPIVRRLIHASADFEFNGLTCFHREGVSAGINSVRAGRPLVADVKMVEVGLAQTRLARFGVTSHCFIADEDVIADAHKEHTTRAVQAMRKAHRLGLLDGGLVVVGNAPTALFELVQLIGSQGVPPALVIGMPVGFVAAAESKATLAELMSRGSSRVAERAARP